LSQQKIFVVVAGNIGTGKTTLTQMLAKRFGWDAHFEAVTDNPYLADFYGDMHRWSFPLQVFFLNNRFKTHQGIANGETSAIQDRSIYEDANIFARNLFDTGVMSERDYRNYLDLYDTMCKFLTPPDLMIYLKKSLPNLKAQIKKRGRDFEQNIPDVYLESLNHNYDDWVSRYNLGKKLVINSDGMDFVKNDYEFNEIAEKIIQQLDQRDFFLESRSSEKSQSSFVL